MNIKFCPSSILVLCKVNMKVMLNEWNIMYCTVLECKDNFSTRVRDGS